MTLSELFDKYKGLLVAGLIVLEVIQCSSAYIASKEKCDYLDRLYIGQTRKQVNRRVGKPDSKYYVNTDPNYRWDTRNYDVYSSVRFLGVKGYFFINYSSENLVESAFFADTFSPDILPDSRELELSQAGIKYHAGKIISYYAGEYGVPDVSNDLDDIIFKWYRDDNTAIEVIYSPNAGIDDVPLAVYWHDVVA